MMSLKQIRHIYYGFIILFLIDIWKNLMLNFRITKLYLVSYFQAIWLTSSLSWNNNGGKVKNGTILKIVLYEYKGILESLENSLKFAKGKESYSNNKWLIYK